MIFTFSFCIPAHAALVSTSINIGNSTLQNGLVGWWTFDGKDIVKGVLKDKSGYGNDGNLRNISTSTFYSIGKIGQAGNFNTTNYAYIGNPSSLQINGDITMCTWAYTRDNSKFFFAKSDGATRDYGMYINSSNNLTLFTSAGSINSTGVISLRKWNHLCITDLGTAVTFYINGASAGTGSASVTNNNSRYLGLGHDGAASGFPYNGYLDDIRIYNRVLSAKEIQELYQSGVGTKQNTSPSIPSPTAGQTNLSTNLVGWWTFDGKNLINNVADSSGKNNTAFLQNFTSTSSAQVIGKIGQGLQFNGTNNYAVSSNVINTGVVTISAWVKINSVPTQNGLIAGFINGIADVAHDKDLYIGTDGKIYFYVYPGSTVTTSAPASTVPLNQWVHVVGVADGTNAFTYMNGQQVGSVPAGNTYAGYNVPDIFVGGATGAPTFGGGYMPQQVDDVRVYTRALSAKEIQELYQSGVGTKQNATVGSPQSSSQMGLLSGLIGWWTFDGKDTNWATGVTLDKSGNSNNGQLMNMSTTSNPTMGKMGQAFDMGTNGASTQYINAGSANIVDNLGSSSPVSISAWINIRSYGGSSQGHILGKPGGGTGLTYEIYSSFKNMYFRIAYGGATNLIAQSAVNSFTTPDFNKWVHVVVTWDGSPYASNVTFYKNGNLLAHGGGTEFNGAGNRASDAVFNLGIGNNTSGTLSRQLDGKIDDVRIYNRVLSAKEVQELYLMGK